MAEAEEILEGKVQAIMTFGAFITLKDGSTGLVHISEISDGYVKDVNDYLKVGQAVRVVEMQSDEKSSKKRLSIKRTGEKLKPLNQSEQGEGNPHDRDRNFRREDRKKDKPIPQKKDFSTPPPMFDEGRSSGSDSFDDKLASFMKTSEERLIDLKHQKENKRGGGYVRRG